MAPSTGIPNESRCRPRYTGLQLPDMRQGRPQLILSDPSAMAPYSAPPGVVPPGSVPPGVVPPGAVPHASVGFSSAVPAAPAPYVRRREDALLRAPSRPTWQGNYWGSWASWNFVPPEKKDQCWHAFIQHCYWEDQFHDEIYLKWKKQTQMVDEGLDEPPSYTALARKTHTGKDGSFLDERIEKLVLERGKTKKGTVYGLGSVQYKNSSASVPIPVSLKRNLDVDMRMSGFETTISKVKEDITGVKEDFSALKAEINAFKTEVTGGCYGETAVDRNNNGSFEEEVDMNNEFIDPQAEDRELKGQLLRKYSGYLGSLKQEFMKKKKKGKLPKEARQQLLDWWSRHYKWPYPPEQQKLALAESTGLDQKQINNWFINQRKRHWKRSEDMQFVVMDATRPHHYFMDNVLGNPFPTDHITSTML
ncbi:hypothetical protein Bca52824_047945 [Brassica carinata]|uniref:Uncharacterized protein n=1 Tax=Brassica carinata TaxID=52824 RepID=A0A8X7RHD5_BRACI|nr:hypothetical protein Bca52824_047945 [Brassica carinata]